MIVRDGSSYKLYSIIVDRRWIVMRKHTVRVLTNIYVINCKSIDEQKRWVTKLIVYSTAMPVAALSGNIRPERPADSTDGLKNRRLLKAIALRRDVFAAYRRLRQPTNNRPNTETRRTRRSAHPIYTRHMYTCTEI